MSDELSELARKLRAGGSPAGVLVLKRSPVRVVIRSGDRLLKLWLRPSKAPRREARAIRLAAARGLPVPELLGGGDDWVATRWLDGRPAERGDIDRILPVVEHMHELGGLHGDLHLGNILICQGEVRLLDLQRMRFLPSTPAVLRRRELGYLAYSLGEPLPAVLASARFWCDRRAHTHWRSRTKRALKESSGFTPFERAGVRGFRRREVDQDRLRAALAEPDDGELLKDDPRTRLLRHEHWILKQHPSQRQARSAWVAAQGLESRGIRTARALAWSGRWLVMEDAGPTLSDWIDAEFAQTCGRAHDELARMLGELLGALHRRGIYHADLKANNIVWSPGAPARLLDYGRVLFRKTLSHHKKVKNLAQLNAALPDAVPGALREAALAHYVRSSGFVGDIHELRRNVIALSLRRQHRWSGCPREQRQHIEAE